MLAEKDREIAKQGVDKSIKQWYTSTMTTLKDIEEAVTHLPNPELGRFRAWFARFDAETWDREFEEDAKSGALDRLADQALKDLAEGRCSKL